MVLDTVLLNSVCWFEAEPCGMRPHAERRDEIKDAIYRVSLYISGILSSLPSLKYFYSLRCALRTADPS